MEDNEKTKVVYTKEMLIKRISNKCRRDTRIVRLVINALEEDIFDILSSADKDKDVSIRLFEGISFESTYLPYRDKTSNLTGEKNSCFRKGQGESEHHQILLRQAHDW